MSGRYAAHTQTSSEASRAEIERILRRYKASEFAYAWKDKLATVGFVIAGRQVRIDLPLPDPMESQFRFTEQRRILRSDSARLEAYEQGVRQRWRALALVIKAKLEAVEAGISTVEREFLADVQLPDGRSVSQWVAPAIEQAYRLGVTPAIEAGANR